MKSFLIGLGTMTASLTLGSMVAFSGTVWSPEFPLQLGLLKLLHDIYSFLLTPLSSALGAPSLGSGLNLGVWPLLIWIISSLFIGFLTGEPVRAAKIVFTSASIIFCFWIFSNFMLYSLWSNSITWLSEIDLVMSDLFLYRSLDIIFFLSVPTIISATSAYLILNIVSSKNKEAKVEEEYPAW